MSKEDLMTKISELYDKYENDEIIFNKLKHHITHELDIILINTKKILISRENRKQLLLEGYTKFINEFINKNRYFYCSTTEIFFKYDNIHYNIVKEDDIIHEILSSLNHHDNDHPVEYYEQQLLPWKFKIKTSTIKQLKEISVFVSIPESSTVQYVISLFLDTLFETKNQVKYFLTILGDIILKKSNNNIYLISPSVKPLLRLLENQGGKYLGHIPITNTFRYKYHDHNYNDCRLINIKNTKINMEEIIGINDFTPIIDIFVVCCHYSNRYDTADKYLNECLDNKLNEYALYLKNNNQSAIISSFINLKIQTSTGSIISMKNMLYLCKCYLDENNISGVIFTANLKLLLKEQLDYTECDDSFYGYTSLGLPLVSNFVKFWDLTIEENIDEYFLEIDEICIIFKQWLGGKSSLDIKDTEILNLIKHFYPDIVIENNKYIYGISCITWSKKDELKTFLNSHDNAYELTSYELYVEYTKKNNKKTTLTVNKSYFDLFMAECKGEPLKPPINNKFIL